MTDLAYAAPVGAAPCTADSTEYIPGDVVRQLVAWSERDIEMLRAELELALKDAESIEERLALLDPGAPRVTALDGHLSESVAATTAMPAETAAWRPQTEWQPQTEWAGSDLTVAVPAVSHPTVAMPAVPAHTVSDPTIAIPAVAALPAPPSFSHAPVSDPTAIVPTVSGLGTWEPSEPIGAPSACPPAAEPPKPGRTGRTTVVYRPPLSAVSNGSEHPAVDERPDPDSNVAPGTAPATRKEIVRGQGGSLGNLVRGRWMMKAGMIIAVMGIVFLKFG